MCYILNSTGLIGTQTPSAKSETLRSQGPMRPTDERDLTITLCPFPTHISRYCRSWGKLWKPKMNGLNKVPTTSTINR